MPRILNHIDAIAREKNRDVLFVVFTDDVFDFSEKYQNLPERNELIHWLTENNIEFQPCFGVAVDGLLIQPYLGHLYLDVVFDENDPVYKKLVNHLENQDGSMKNPNVKFMYLPLEMALKNSHHDDPNYYSDMYE